MMGDGIYPHSVVVTPILDRDPDGVPLYGEPVSHRALVVMGEKVIRRPQGQEIVRQGVVYCDGKVEVSDAVVELPSDFAPRPNPTPILNAPMYPDEFGRIATTELWI